MSYIRLFFKENLSLNFNSNLDKSQSHYISKVMRIKEGENFSLFNNTGEWQVRIEEIRKGIVNFEVIKKIKNIENTSEIWLAFTPIKLNYLDFGEVFQKQAEKYLTLKVYFFTRVLVKSPF